MRRPAVFWGTVLVLVGLVLFLDNLGVFGDLSVWRLIWPLLLIAVGVWVLVGTVWRAQPAQMEPASIPLQGAARAAVKVQHGAGRLTVGAGAAPGQLVSGEFAGGLDYTAERQGDTLKVRMKPATEAWAFPWAWGARRGLDWNLRFTEEIPLALKFETGAGEYQLDLSGLRVTELELETGASATSVVLPAQAGHTEAKISCGAASVNVRVPEGVAARIRVDSGLAGISVNRERFPRVEGGYRSPDYDTAANKVDLKIEAGVGSVDVG